MPCAEAKQAAKSALTKGVRDRIHVHANVGIAKTVEHDGGLCVIGVFRGDRTAFQKVGNALRKMPFRCLDAVGGGIGVLYANE